VNILKIVYDFFVTLDGLMIPCLTYDQDSSSHVLFFFWSGCY